MNTDNKQIIAKAEIPDQKTLRSALTKAGKERKQRKPRKLNPDKVLELAHKGMKTADIAKHQGVNPTTVWRFLEKNTNIYNDLKIFKDHAGDVHLYDRFKTRVQRMRILEAMEQADDSEFTALDLKQKSAIIKELKVAEGIMEDKEMDAREGRTTPVNYFQVNVSVSELDREEAILRAELEGN